MAAEPVRILGIETSCDETAAAVVADGRDILSNIISSQVELHARFGGVVPEIASRQHLLLLNALIDDALKQAGLKFSDLQAVAVSHGPGLVGALLVGVAVAKALAYALRLPLIAVNHLEAHLYANNLTGSRIDYPAVILIVSGGHSELLLLARPGSITPLGRTRDDAAGEAFDKVARVMELGYPGGPLIDELARKGDPAAIEFPRAWLNSSDNPFDFSFSGLKTAVINYLYHARRRNEKVNLADLAASFQEALVEVLVEKTVAAARAYRVKTVLLAGGVAANSHLRRRMEQRLSQSLPAVPLHCPPLDLCTDNAAMIAAAAYPLYLKGDFAPLNLNANPGLGIGRP
jgi:N6-L-threonylcarbamoyladenine synthase